MTKYKWPIIAGIAIVVGAVYVLWNPPSTKDKYIYWRGEYNALKSIAEANEQIKLATIAELEGKNSLLQGSIDSANTIIAQLEQDVVEAEVEVAEARKGWDKFSVECQAKLKTLDLSWSAVHEIDRKEIAALKTANFDLLGQYNNQIRISQEHSGLWVQEKTLRMKAETGLNLADKRIRSLQRKAKLTLPAMAAVVVAVLLLRK